MTASVFGSDNIIIRSDEIVLYRLFPGEKNKTVVITTYRVNRQSLSETRNRPRVPDDKQPSPLYDIIYCTAVRARFRSRTVAAGRRKKYVRTCTRVPSKYYRQNCCYQSCAGIFVHSYTYLSRVGTFSTVKCMYSDLFTFTLHVYTLHTPNESHIIITTVVSCGCDSKKKKKIYEHNIIIVNNTRSVVLFLHPRHASRTLFWRFVPAAAVRCAVRAFECFETKTIAYRASLERQNKDKKFVLYDEQKSNRSVLSSG